MRYKKDDRVILTYEEYAGEKAIIVEFAKLNDTNGKCWWLKRENGKRWEESEDNCDDFYRNDRFELLFWEGFFKRNPNEKKKVKQFGIAKWCKEHYV